LNHVFFPNRFSLIIAGDINVAARRLAHGAIHLQSILYRELADDLQTGGYDDCR